MKKNYFFCGIGGSGMSAIAQILLLKGYDVKGSDRNLETSVIADLREKGIKIFPQDGSGLDGSVDVFVVSTAVEDTVLDVVRAKQLGNVIKKRAEILAEIIAKGNGIAVAGTSGKTTTTAMLGHIMICAGMKPDVVNGGIMLNYGASMVAENGDFVVVEADESDGSIALYNPKIAVVTNISLDHKPLEELRELFKAFVQKATVGAILNADCVETLMLEKSNNNVITYSIQNRKATLMANNIEFLKNEMSFMVSGVKFRLPLMGLYNVSNAMAAISAAFMAGVSLEKAAVALKTFRGVHRRLEVVGEKNNLVVIDDFAHNPAKIEASLTALQMAYPQKNLAVVYQPHGFAPTRLMKDELIDVFVKLLRGQDVLIMLDIFYAGGTVARDISSADLANVLQARGVNVRYMDSRDKAVKFLKNKSQESLVIVVMGARDETLSLLAEKIWDEV